jgi:hypothetical protein
VLTSSVLAFRALLLLVVRAPAAGAACQPVPALSTSIVVDSAVMLELEAPPNGRFAGTAAVTRAKRGRCGKPLLAARVLFMARCRRLTSCCAPTSPLITLRSTCSTPASSRAASISLMTSTSTRGHAV